MVTLSNTARSGGTIATAGLYYGFGSFTYSGGEVLASGISGTLTNIAKNSATISNQSKL